MAYKVRLEKKAEKELKKIPNHDRLRISIVLLRLKDNPFKGKKLRGEYIDSYSLRVWPYRIIYKIYKEYLLVIVIHIGHRQGIYKKNI